MLGRFLRRIFGRRDASSRPPAAPSAHPPGGRSPMPPPPPGAPPPAAPAPTLAAPPPPPPLLPGQPPPEPALPGPVPAAPAPPVAVPRATHEEGGALEMPDPEERPAPGHVRLILADGTMVEPTVDEEFEERLRYLANNLMPPADGPAT